MDEKERERLRNLELRLEIMENTTPERLRSMEIHLQKMALNIMDVLHGNSVLKVTPVVLLIHSFLIGLLLARELFFR